jgi:glyoxylase-like metal-dependent hydrolase (beta-lactamase superfamily II)
MSRLGSYHLYSIEAGRLALDGGAMFGIVPKPLWERRIPADERNRIPLAMRCLLLEGNGKLILIDNGLGDKYDDRFASIYAVDDTSSNLTRSLRAAGFGPDDITDVILTHLHFDHCGGSTHRIAGELVPSFPHATFHVQRRHWEWAQAPNVRERGSFFRENMEPLQASGQLNLVDGRAELFEGIEVRPVFGHTEAQQIVLVRGDHKSLAYVADLLPTHAHLSPAWNMAYDLRPLETIREKSELLDEFRRDSVDLFFEHDPVVVVASVTGEGERIETADHRSLEEL